MGISPAPRSDSEPGKGRLLYVGNFVSWFAEVKPYCECLANALETDGWFISRTSSRRSQISRALEMMMTVWSTGPEVGAVLIDVFSTKAFLWAELASRIAGQRGVPVILMLRGGRLLERAIRSPRRVEDLFRRAVAINTPAESLQRGLARYSDKPIVYLPDGLSIQSYEFGPRTTVRPRIIWLRALHSLYAPEVAVRALGFLRDSCPYAHLLMVGPDRKDGSLRRLNSLIEELGLEESVEWIGAVDKAQVPSVMQKGDVFLNTSTADSFGGSVVEAAACGLCIVTTDAGELKYLWQDGHDALLVPVNDPEAMSRAILRILEEPDLAANLSKNARLKAETFDWSNVIPEWNRILSAVSRSGRAGT